jgi:hypothetical protein
LIVGIMTLLPPFVTSNFRIQNILQINSFILTNSIKHDFSFLFPISNLIILIILLGTFFFGKYFQKAFSIFICLSYLVSGFLQNISISDQYGFAISFSTLFLTLFVAGSWLYEVFSNQNEFTKLPHPQRLIVFVPIAVFAIWQPLNPMSLALDFNPVYFLTSGSSLTFCMMTIVSISVLLTYFPNVNKTTLTITSIVGLLIGVGNLWLEFIYMPDLFWVGVLHIPLVLVSLIGITFSLIRARSLAV